MNYVKCIAYVIGRDYNSYIWLDTIGYIAIFAFKAGQPAAGWSGVPLARGGRAGSERQHRLHREPGGELRGHSKRWRSIDVIAKLPLNDDIWW